MDTTEHETIEEGCLNRGADISDEEHQDEERRESSTEHNNLTLPSTSHDTCEDPPPPYEALPPVFLAPPYTLKAEDAQAYYHITSGFTQSCQPPPSYPGDPIDYQNCPCYPPDRVIIQPSSSSSQLSGCTLGHNDVMMTSSSNEELRDPPNDYMMWSVCVTLCCCWIIGMSAMHRSRECRDAIAAGNRELAAMKSREAKTRITYSICVGLICLTVVAGVVGIRYGLMFG